MLSQKLKKNTGATLLELLLTTLISILVVGAVCSAMLLYFQAKRLTLDKMETQTTIRIMQTALNKLSGEINGIQIIKDNHGNTIAWRILGKETGDIRPVLLEYVSGEVPEKSDPLGVLRVGGSVKKRDNDTFTAETYGVEILNDIETTVSDISELQIGEHAVQIEFFVNDRKYTEKHVVTDSNNKYSITLYHPLLNNVCVLSQIYDANSNTKEQFYEPISNRNLRNFVPPVNAGTDDIKTNVSDKLYRSEPRRLDFLATLAGELGSDGRIRGTETYYSEWYLGGTYALNPDWNEATPWCACYLSWALAEQPEDAMSEVPCFAHVDAGAEWFRTRALWTDASEAAPGDLVFFDWDGDGTPDHVGAVLDTDAERLTTLEGNSNGQVECRSWPADSPFIQGVGVLPWKG